MPGIEHQLGVFGHLPVVDVSVRRQHDDTIGAANLARGEGDGRVLGAVNPHAGDVRIVVGDQRAALLQQAQHLHRGRFPRVSDVAFVARAEPENARARDGGAAVGRDRLGHTVGHVGRHGLVDLRRERGQPRGDPARRGLPREVVGVHGDAVPPDARAGIERHEPERLGRGGADHLPDVDAQGFAQAREFVHERDVHAAKHILEQLGHLRGACRRHRVDRRLELFEQPLRQRRAHRGDAAHHSRNRARRVAPVTRVDPLGRERQKEILADAEPGLCQRRERDLLGGSRVRGALQHDELSRVQAAGDCSQGGGDKGQIRLMRYGDRRLHANDGDIRRGERSELACAREAAAQDQRPQRAVRHILHVRDSARETRGARPVGLEAHDREAGLGEPDRQRQPDVPESDDAHGRPPFRDAAFQRPRRRPRELPCRHRASSRVPARRKYAMTSRIMSSSPFVGR